VSGGGWTQRDHAWVNDVFAYNLSMACNHCEKPICAEVCPTHAIVKRHDGIVLIDADKCIGCKYCSWACPYGAPQYDDEHGCMTKCTFCFDNIDAGLPPSCVAACPLRVLELDAEISRSARNDNIFPLPQSKLTEPAIVINPHKDAHRADEQSAQIANREEVGHAENHEHSLVVFTLLAQMAVGAFGVLAVMMGFGNSAAKNLFIIIPPMMAIAMLVSFLHLGAPLKAWRAFANLGSSWLSREILFAMLFAGASTFVVVMQWFGIAQSAHTSFIGATVLLGIALVVAMTNVYRLRTVETWNTWTTPRAFFRATCLLGACIVGMLIALTENALFLGILCAIGFGIVLGIEAKNRFTFYESRVKNRRLV
jgi:anaerobic dimethyl sulfoxide reductase subunit B (iron-sulfur subunit)